MKIYTGRGDEGMTDLRDTSQVSKASPRTEAYGTVDEANALIGTARPAGYDDIDDTLGRIQNQSRIVQADFANPDPDEGDPAVTTEHVESLEDAIDETEAELDPVESFILPGGSDAGAALHHARAVTRHAERCTVELAADAGERRGDPVSQPAFGRAVRPGTAGQRPRRRPRGIAVVLSAGRDHTRKKNA